MMNDQQIRAEQIESARRQGGTLRTPYNRREKSIQAPKGHEAFLKALEASVAKVYFEKASSGNVIVGTVKCSDKYTVSVIDEDGQTRVLFKHDISEFWTHGKSAHEVS